MLVLLEISFVNVEIYFLQQFGIELHEFADELLSDFDSSPVGTPRPEVGGDNDDRNRRLPKVEPR